MFRVIRERLKQKKRTIPFPVSDPILPERYRGFPVLNRERCAGHEGCKACVQACPTHALSYDDTGFEVDLGRCLACVDCSTACPNSALSYNREYKQAASCRSALIVRNNQRATKEIRAAKHIRDLFSKSFKLRQVSAGGCNGCELDTNVLTTNVFDLGRFSVEFVASPRHADGLLVTGPVTGNMKEALLKTYAAIPDPKVVIAVGACALSGGIYNGHPDCCDGVDSVLPVDLYVPGCPPHPLTILDALLRFLGRKNG